MDDQKRKQTMARLKTKLQSTRPPPQLPDLMQGATPTIPEAVVNFYAQKAGIQMDDVAGKLIALATEKFVSDIILDASMEARMKGQGQAKKNAPGVKYTLTNEILKTVLSQRGIDLTTPPYSQ